MTKWCELCEEIEATCSGATLCTNCYQRIYYWMRKGSPAALVRRREALKLWLKTNSLLLGKEDVLPFDKEDVA